MSLESWLRNVIPPLYLDPNRTIYDVTVALQTFNALQPSIGPYTYNDGRQCQMLSLKGTIPVVLRGQVYNIPIQVWLSSSYPNAYPRSYVTPTSTMSIKPSKHVDSNGTIYHPYLSDWAGQTQRANLHEWFSILQHLFAQECPVYSKPSTTQSPTSSSSSPKSQTASSSAQPQVLNLPSNPQVLSQSFAAAGQVNPRAASGSTEAKASPNAANPPPYSVGALGGFQSFHQSVNVSPGAQSFFQQQQQPQPPKPAASLIDQKDEPALIQRTLDTALREKITRQFKLFNEKITKMVDQLLQEAKTLNDNEAGVQDIKIRSAEQAKQLQDAITKVQQVKADLDAWIEKIDKEPDIDLDTALAPKTVVEAQLCELVAEEAAIEDVLYYFGQALAKEKIELDIYLKHTRSLAREQFLKKALIKKIKLVLA